MPQSNAYLDARPSGRRYIGLGIAVLAHIVLIYALVNGLGRKVLEIVKPTIETKIIEEVKPPPPPPPEAPPPPPKLTAPPPPFIPPPEIKIANPPPAVIAQVTTTAPPAPVAPVIAPPAPPAPKAEPAPAPPPAPKPRFRTNVKPIYVPPVQELIDNYPRQAAREGITGTLVIHITVSPNGDVKDAVVKEANPKRIFDKVALEYIRRYKFPPGDDEFETEQPIVFRLE